MGDPVPGQSPSPLSTGTLADQPRGPSHHSSPPPCHSHIDLSCRDSICPPVSRRQASQLPFTPPASQNPGPMGAHGPAAVRACWMSPGAWGHAVPLPQNTHPLWSWQAALHQGGRKQARQRHPPPRPASCPLALSGEGRQEQSPASAPLLCGAAFVPHPLWQPPRRPQGSTVSLLTGPGLVLELQPLCGPGSQSSPTFPGTFPTKPPMNTGEVDKERSPQRSCPSTRPRTATSVSLTCICVLSCFVS